MGSSLLDLANNLFEGIRRIKCKYKQVDKKCETCTIKYKCCEFYLEHKNFKYDLIEYKCLCCNENCQQQFGEKLKEQLFNTYKFSNHTNNKFILLL